VSESFAAVFFAESRCVMKAAVRSKNIAVRLAAVHDVIGWRHGMPVVTWPWDSLLLRVVVIGCQVVRYTTARSSFVCSCDRCSLWLLSRLVMLVTFGVCVFVCVVCVVIIAYMLVKKRLKLCIALHGKPISELRDVTCHIGPHSVICHPTQVNTPRLNPNQ